MHSHTHFWDFALVWAAISILVTSFAHYMTYVPRRSPSKTNDSEAK